jgi:hypothetical protein
MLYKVFPVPYLLYVSENRVSSAQQRELTN